MFKILTTVLLLIGCYFIVFYSYRVLYWKRKRSFVSNDSSHEILNEVKSNNSYPLILDVFTSLNEELEECGEELHVELRGYLDAGETN